MAPDSPVLPLPDSQPSSMLGIGDDIDFQLLLEILAVSGAAASPPADVSPFSATYAQRSPWEIAADCDAADQLLLRCGTSLPHPGQSPPEGSDCQTAVPPAMLPIDTTSCPTGSLSSLPRPVTPQRSGAIESRRRLTRDLSRTGSSKGSACEPPADDCCAPTESQEAAASRSVERRCCRTPKSQRRSADAAEGGKALETPSLKRRMQNREAQQRRRQRLKARSGRSVMAVQFIPLRDAAANF